MCVSYLSGDNVEMLPSILKNEMNGSEWMESNDW